MDYSTSKVLDDCRRDTAKKKNNAPLWKGCFQTTVLLTVEKATEDYFPALLSQQGLRGDYFVDMVSEKAYTRWLPMDN